MEKQTPEEKILAAQLKLTQEILEHYRSIHSMINSVATGLVGSLHKAKFERTESPYYIIPEKDFDESFKKASSLRQNGWKDLDSYSGCKDDLKAIQIKEEILKKLQ